MARGKKSKLAQRPKGVNGQTKGKFSNSPSREFGLASNNDEDQDAPLFSLRDAARRHYGSSLLGHTNISLRERGVTFVPSAELSMKVLEGTIKDAPEVSVLAEKSEFIPHHAAENPGTTSSPTVQTPSPTQPSVSTTVEPAVAPLNNPENSEASLTSSAPSHQITNQFMESPRRQLSRSSTGSCEDIILFSGRKKFGKNKANSKQPEESSTSIDPPVVAAKPFAQNAVLFPREREVAVLPASTTWDNSGVDWVHESRSTPIASGSTTENSDLDSFAADYIENLLENNELEDIIGSNFTVKTSLKADHYHSTIGPVPSHPKSVRTLDNFHRSGWRPSDIIDFDDISTSDEVLDAVEHVLSKRVRPNGLQYLIVWRGQSIDEARWTPISSLVMPGAIELIKDFEDSVEQLPSDNDDRIKEGISSDRQRDDATGNRKIHEASSSSEDDWHERDLEKRQISRMTDEDIAFLLSKQEEFGMGSNELVLFDNRGNHLDTDDMYKDEDIAHLLSSSKKARLTASSKRKNQIVSVPLALADSFLRGDDYGEFDVMDRERPSLSGRVKDKDSIFAPNLSDSDLEAALQKSWATDRNKKSLKKREREELRAQGLLGNKNKSKPDLSAKYQDGISMEQIKSEIEKFMMSNLETLALPPLDKRDRKHIHTIAHNFNLNSKSVGSGHSRFPILYKTSKTRSYGRSALPALQTELNRRFFPRMDRRGRGPRISGNSASDIGYRDGDVVGASAPQIGAENRGRAMLEKMGWSSGTALGASNNKGILEPVSHVVRKSKAGLG